VGPSGRRAPFDGFEHQHLGAVQVRDDRPLRSGESCRGVHRGQVMQGDDLATRRPGRSPGAAPRVHLAVEQTLVEGGEHAVRRACPVLEGGVQRHRLV